jgi:hypothetical protein
MAPPGAMPRAQNSKKGVQESTPQNGTQNFRVISPKILKISKNGFKLCARSHQIRLAVEIGKSLFLVTLEKFEKMFFENFENGSFQKFQKPHFQKKNSDAASVVIGSETRVLQCRRMDPFSTSGSEMSDRHQI